MKKTVMSITLILLALNIYAEKIYSYLPFKKRNQIAVSSYLTEGDVNYYGSKLSPNDRLPWIPDYHQNGKNEYIEIKDCEVSEIYISIGYVDKKRPDLYYKNSRPKKIRVNFEMKGVEKDYILEDTSKPQKILLLNTNGYVGTIKIYFLEVYEGTKYKDLCINFIARKEIEEDSRIYEAIQKINEDFKISNKYLYILTDKDDYYPKFTYTGCPIESIVRFKHDYIHVGIDSLGDGFDMRKDFITNTLIPEFERNGIEFDKVEYQFEENYNGIYYAAPLFYYSNVKYDLRAWMYDEDFFILRLYLSDN